MFSTIWCFQRSSYKELDFKVDLATSDHFCLRNYIWTFPFTAASSLGWLGDSSTLTRGHLENEAIFFGRPISSLDTRDPGERERGIEGFPCHSGIINKSGCTLREFSNWRWAHATSGTLLYCNSDTRGLMKGEASTQIVFVSQTLTYLVEIDHLVSIKWVPCMQTMELKSYFSLNNKVITIPYHSFLQRNGAANHISFNNEGRNWST